ncbi:hypothetical protein IW261DRAFT_1515589 [Armillaria novae-zelandiae]|uniref:HMG box domain-containing protein n=1 Tax=Armillaria novae-zelandiae TaxID=153914 RepID=A0AA39NS24_9AGAR|nr:hypothetical protein IW261DRAFT_1515589 [Armillaria novae-zelandiae]
MTLPTPSSSTAVLSNGLPQPPSFIENKNTHALKQRPERIPPRPRNEFILFRCQFVRQHCVPPSVEKDNRNISRIAGFVWRGMNDSQKLPWKVLAEEEKIEHARLYPDYKFQPKKRSRDARQSVRRGIVDEHPNRCAGQADYHQRPPLIPRFPTGHGSLPLGSP